MTSLRSRCLALGSITFVCLAMGCADNDDAGEEIPKQPESSVPLLGGDCDPIAPTYCGLPFPSNVYLADDPDGIHANGKRVNFGPTTLPPRHDDSHAPPDLFYDHDGFSPSQAPLAHLPLAKCSACATPYSIEKSLEPDHPTVLLEVPTGRKIPHWVDLDMSTANDGIDDREDQRLLMIRPAERLKDNTRYIVAIRNVEDVNEAVIAPSPAFKALRDGKLLSKGTAAEKWSVYARKGLYKEIFSELDKAGVDKKDLQLAWDYSTASKENITGRIMEMRDLALAAVGDDGPTFTVKSVEELPPEDENLIRRINLVMTVPLYLTTAAVHYDKKKPMDRLNIGADGKLKQNGTMEWDVLVLVPKSVQSSKKHGLLQNGHGLFGSRTEGQGGYLARAANHNAWIAFSTNLFGFDENSVPLALDLLLGNFQGIKGFPERQFQGMVNQLLAMRMMMGRVAKEGIKDSKGTLILDPAWVDKSVRAYRGDSQGGIMGGTYMAVSTDVTRGLLGETGMPYNVLLNRSFDWPAYEIMLESGFDFNGAYAQLMLGAVQMSWDRVEPGGLAPYMTDDLMPNTPAHHVLMHIARGDHQVTPFGAHIMARAIGAVQLESDDAAQPVFDDYYGIERGKGPLTDKSVLVEYDFGLKPLPVTNTPAKDGCDPHDRVRDLTPSFDQQDEFFRTGKISWFCKGACNCNDAVTDDPNEEDRCENTKCK
ncbi:MAG: hypothetical protein IPI67_34850 [Myxococcales bacterium]|nr:hypothetical protein [Myxococcales bacterium]